MIDWFSVKDLGYSSKKGLRKAKPLLAPSTADNHPDEKPVAQETSKDKQPHSLPRNAFLLAAPVVLLALLFANLQYSGPSPLRTITALNTAPSFIAAAEASIRSPVTAAKFYANKARLAWTWWKVTGVKPGAGQCLSKRFVETDFISLEECDVLQKLAEFSRTHQNVGDELTGTNIWELLSLNASREDLAILKRTRDRMRDAVELAIPNETPLYLDYTHLTSRTPGNFDYSHGIHADNCRLSHDRTECLELPENCCSWRSRSALLYLNGEPEISGGEFLFSDEPECGGELIVRPKCGLMAAFSSGRENPHGVLKVHNGTRRALALWFTYDKNRKEYTSLDTPGWPN
ncbi:hypothetical protein M427DRAFT_32443 [Gonapodya prolifera JEL478]|uniref:procollagen-proline 3-dioxygenase n=1 Tax=Gonapodya prolifera (strain JEL478) TaxID=1344416 RepID=A0A139AEV7_GONPJ|nr:hypothetical protein M427DRAFT_32443 [Gonapodya prolifera JEL478]|eukprot:KXS15209.1 hypothetical protein M427DRAFT_32443 [Gonapodya prolifera JEL478]